MGGSDDASLFLADVQKRGGSGSYVMVGADNPAPHHNPAFDVDERALAHSVDLLEALLRGDVSDEAWVNLSGFLRQPPERASRIVLVWDTGEASVGETAREGETTRALEALPGGQWPGNYAVARTSRSLE